MPSFKVILSYEDRKVNKNEEKETNKRTVNNVCFCLKKQVIKPAFDMF